MPRATSASKWWREASRWNSTSGGLPDQDELVATSGITAGIWSWTRRERLGRGTKEIARCSWRRHHARSIALPAHQRKARRPERKAARAARGRVPTDLVVEAKSAGTVSIVERPSHARPYRKSSVIPERPRLVGSLLTTSARTESLRADERRTRARQRAVMPTVAVAWVFPIHQIAGTPVSTIESLWMGAALVYATSALAFRIPDDHPEGGVHAQYRLPGPGPTDRRLGAPQPQLLAWFLVLMLVNDRAGRAFAMPGTQ